MFNERPDYDIEIAEGMNITANGVTSTQLPQLLPSTMKTFKWLWVTHNVKKVNYLFFEKQIFEEVSSLVVKILKFNSLSLQLTLGVLG